MKYKVFGLLLLPVFLASCSKKQETIHAEWMPVTESVYASGVVKGQNQYQVFAKVAGQIEQIYVNEGDAVKPGDPILKIASSTATISRDNASEAARFNARANNQDKLQELKNNLELLLLKLRNDSLLWLRQQNLWQQNVGTQLELEQKELNYKNSVSNYNSALLRYEQLKRQLTFADRQSALNLELSNAQLSDLLVKSEIKGRVYDVFKKPGDMINLQTPLAVIADAQNFYLELQVDELDIARIQKDQQVFVTMDSYKGKVFEARVSKIHPLMNEKTKTFLIEARFVNAPERLYPNLTCEVNIVISQKEKALLIPRTYLDAENMVTLESGEKRAVKTGLMDYQRVEITEGLTETETLIKPK